MALLGLDIGTTGCKSSVVDESGRCKASCYQEYHVKRENGTHELDANVIWESVQTVLSKSIKESGEKIQAIAVSSFGESFVAVDHEGNALAGVMLYTDVRGTQQASKLSAEIGDEQVMHICGVKPHAMYSLPKMMWFAENRPELFSKVYKFLLIQDYIIFKLTGEAYTDYSLASRTMALDITQKKWSQKILDCANIDPKYLATPVLSGTAVGVVLKEIAQRLGLSEDTVVVTGGHDQVCSAVGAGAITPGVSVDGTGTVECITPVFDRPVTNRIMMDGGYACVPHAEQGLYVTYAFSFTGGAILKWYRDNFARHLTEKAAAEGGNVYRLLDESVRDEPSGLLVLPHFAGAATPYMDESAVGTIMGLTLATEGRDIYRAVMEGVTYEMLLNIRLLENAGISIRELRATGGGASSKVWLQIKADIIGVPIVSLGSCEAGTMGCIALAGTAIGQYPSLSEATHQLLTKGEVFYPNASRHEQYQEWFERYKKIYDATKSVMR